MPYRIVPINPKSGRVIKRPRKDQPVIFSLLGPRGGIKKLSKHSQPYLKKDLKGLLQQVEKTKGGNFVAYEQLTKKKFTQSDYKQRQARKKDIGLYKTKLTGPQPANSQRPMFYVKGTPRRALDLGFKRGNKIKSSERKPQIVAKAGTPEREAKTRSFYLYGSTIKEALGRLQLDTMLRAIKGKILYYTMKLRVYEPKRGGGWKKPVDIPASGSIIPGRDPFVGHMVIDGKLEPAKREQIPIIANMKTQIAKTIRYSLKDSGYKFTSLVTIKKIQNSEKHRIAKFEQNEERKIDNMAANLSVRTETIYNARDELDKKVDNAWDAYDGIAKIGMFNVKHQKLKQITDKWKIEVFINFEIAG